MTAEQALSLRERKQVIASHRKRARKYADDWDMLEYAKRRTKAIECLDIQILYLTLSVQEDERDELFDRFWGLLRELENCSVLTQDDRQKLRQLRTDFKEFERVKELLEGITYSLDLTGVTLSELARYSADALPYVEYLLGGDVAHLVDDTLFPGESQEVLNRTIDRRPLKMSDADYWEAIYRLRVLRGQDTGPLDPDLLAQCQLWSSSHPELEVRKCAQQLISKHYLICGDYQRSIDSLIEVVPELEYLMNLVGLVRSEPINLETALTFLCTNLTLTDFGLKHQDEVMEITEVLLQEHQRDRGLNLIEEFCFDHGLASEVPEDQWAEGLPGITVHARVQGSADYVAYGLYLFPELDHRKNDVVLRIPWRTVRKVESQVSRRVASFLRDAEDVLRESMGISRIGEGLVAEPLLLHRIREAFPDELVIAQGKPPWLLPQSFDVYFPNRSIAVEYQGEQHSSPIEYFGGSASFAMQQERDARKKRLCAENRCALIEVFPGYDLSNVITQIRPLLDKRS